jgi:USP6 N-terminal-like protein
MEAPSLILIPPTPQPVRSIQPSPLSTSTAASGSSLPELAPSAIDKERSSSETTIVTIYSMYEGEEESWSSSAPHLDHRRRSTKPIDVAITNYRDSYIPPNSRPAEDSGYYDATYDVMRPQSKLLGVAAQNRLSGMTDDSTELAYSDSRPASSYARTSTGTRIPSTSESHRRSGAQSSEGGGQPPRSRQASGLSSRPASRASSQLPHSLPQPQMNGSSHNGLPTPWATPRLSSTSLPSAEHGLAQSPHLTVPSTPASTPPRRPSKTSTPDSKHSQLSLVRSEGEDADAYYVRSTYAQLDMTGVKGDGVEEGVERTRARVGGSRASELRADEALADENEKTRELTPREIQLLSSLDR